MAYMLNIGGLVTSGTTAAYMSFVTPGQDAITATKTDDYALEYDIFYQGLNRGWDTLAFTGHDEMSSPFNGPWIDQEGLAPAAVSAVDALFARMFGVWYHRVIPIGKSGFPGATLMENFRVGVWLTHPTGTPLFSSISYAISNIRITRFRETVLWLWREDMALPTLDAASGITSPSISRSVIGAPTLPSYCANGKHEVLDDIQSRRFVGGRLNSNISWDGTKAAFTLSDIRLSIQQKWDLLAFYELFRRDAIVYQHEANLPAMLCRFLRPPTFEEEIDAGRLTYRTQLVLAQR